MTNLLETLNLISMELALDVSVDIVFLNFLKAFDMVPHRILLKKLKGYGVTDSLLEWFKSFLLDRRQRVVLEDSESDWGEVLSGVQQGSVLGPLLFIFYINDLPDSVECECKLYADDNKLISVVRNGLEGIGMQNNIDSVTNCT